LQGFARAKAKGVKLGRRPVKPSVEARIRELKAEGMGILKIGRTVGVGTSVVQRVLTETVWLPGKEPNLRRFRSAEVPELKLIIVLDGQGGPLGRKEMFSSFPRQCVLSLSRAPLQPETTH
jgi:hypothetical protein